MNDGTEVKTLTAAEYFLNRKKHIDRYVQGEHAWLGAVDSEVVFNSRPWYLDSSAILEQQVHREPLPVI